VEKEGTPEQKESDRQRGGLQKKKWGWRKKRRTTPFWVGKTQHIQPGGEDLKKVKSKKGKKGSGGILPAKRKRWGQGKYCLATPRKNQKSFAKRKRGCLRETDNSTDNW